MHTVLHDEGSQAIEFLQAQVQGWQGLLGMVCFICSALMYLLSVNMC